MMMIMKTLNEDVKLTQTTPGKWDLKFENNDYVNTTGEESLANACIIAILTRYKELHTNPIYKDFGCRLHELIKDNQTKLHLYKLELFVREILEKIRRVKSIDEIRITKNDAYNFHIHFTITSINDNKITGGLTV